MIFGGHTVNETLLLSNFLHVFDSLIVAALLKETCGWLSDYIQLESIRANCAERIRVRQSLNVDWIIFFTYSKHFTINCLVYVFRLWCNQAANSMLCVVLLVWQPVMFHVASCAQLYLYLANKAVIWVLVCLSPASGSTQSPRGFWLKRSKYSCDYSQDLIA